MGQGQKTEIEKHGEKLKKNDGAKSGDTLKKNEKKVKKATLEDFQMIRLLGEGNFGKVMQVKKKDDGKIYAMKILSKKKLVDSDQLEHTITERSLLQLSDHPFLVGLKYAFQSSDKLYMVMDFVNGGELFFHLKKEKRFSEKRMQLYAAEIFLAVSHLHSLNVVYRDLKPENVLLDHEGHVKLADFGLSKILDQKNTRTHTFCGTPEYLAPEVILQEGHGKDVDWWSFGTLLYELMIGLPPFYDQDVQTMYSKILYSDLEIPDIISKEAVDLLARLLERNPKKRLGHKSTDEIKNHGFFNGLNWDDVYNRKYKPLFKPDVTDPLDTSYFDEEYTKRSLPKSLLGDGKILVDSKTQKAFDGFTFTESTMLNLKKENGKIEFKK